MNITGTSRRTVASYGEYAQAQAAVDTLSDKGFPVQRLAIVGHDLQIVEDVTGRRGLGRAALEGAGSGAVTGAVVGALLGLFTLFDPLTSAFALALWGLVIGAVIGALLGLGSHAATGGRRDFSSVSDVRAGRYEVMADAEVADEAVRLLGAA